jgi:AbrB family looped-hinge helix DNA binding protein
LKLLGDSKLSKKFQVTVPRNVRDFLRLDSGDLLVFLASKNAIVVKRGELRIRPQA